MKIILLFLSFFLTIFSTPNQKPIIGIITQQNCFQGSKQEGRNVNTFIQISYVEYIQMSGAQVVPIFAYSEESQIEEILSKVNGVIFPGGAIDLDIKDRWTSNANFILQYAKKQNDQGNVFPIMGICLGHQLLGYLTNNFQDPLQRVQGQFGTNNTVNFISKDKGYLFSEMSSNLIQKLTKKPGVAFFNHHWAITRKTYDESQSLNSFWKLIGETTTIADQKFVSIWEARNYPFYGVQFHPENTIYGWKSDSDKSYDSVQISQIISNKFMEKARQSKNYFPNQTQFEQKNIQNYVISFTNLNRYRIYALNQTYPGLKLSQNQNLQLF